MTRKFYKTTFVYEVLSDAPLGGDYELTELDAMTDSGDCVGRFGETVQVELTPKQMADALHAFGSEPGFFCLGDDGEDRLMQEENNS